MPSRPTLVILGASTRAAAFSALRAGYTPVCGDLFADADLAQLCQVTRSTKYPADLASLAHSAPDGPWMYTGALENYPALVDSLAGSRPLYGNPAGVLRKVRDPFQLARVLKQSGLPAPDCRATADGLAASGWLRKSRRSSGGIHVRIWTPALDSGQSSRAWYYQRRIEGMPCAAVYLGCSGRAWLWGATEQLLASSRRQADFRYAGSIGPLHLAPAVAAQLEHLGGVLAGQFALTGLFGVDGVLNADGFWPVEVNPRYTASVEILERATGLSGVGAHVAACLGRLPRGTARAAPGWFGKAILYAPSKCTVPAHFTQGLLMINAGRPWPAAADIPRPGTALGAGQPVTTLLADAADRQALLAALREQLAAWRQELLYGS
ncbi:MAG: ATP-grasp domain-containing protein [Pirellulales bacterium]